MSGCCNEPGCERENPILLRQPLFSGKWLVITRYARNGDAVTVDETHELDGVTSEALNRAFVERDDWANLREATAKVRELMKHVGLDPTRRVASGHTFAQVLAAQALDIDVAEHKPEVELRS